MEVLERVRLLSSVQLIWDPVSEVSLSVYVVDVDEDSKYKGTVGCKGSVDMDVVDL